MKLIETQVVVTATDNDACGAMARTERCQKGISLREVARRMDISAMFLSDLERGNRGWTKQLVKKFNRALKAEPPVR